MSTFAVRRSVFSNRRADKSIGEALSLPRLRRMDHVFCLRHERLALSLYAMPGIGWRRSVGLQAKTWQTSMNKPTAWVGSCRFPGSGPRDHPTQRHNTLVMWRPIFLKDVFLLECLLHHSFISISPLLSLLCSFSRQTLKLFDYLTQ